MSKRLGPDAAGDAGKIADDVHDEESEAEAALDAGTDPATADPAEVPLLTNGQLAQVFHDIGDLLEVKGELVFKTVAYHRAA